MSMGALAVGGMAGLGFLGGLFKSGPDMNTQGRGEMVKAMEAYRNLMANGPGAQDVEKATNTTREYGDFLRNMSSSGLYDFSKGNQLAEQAFAGQREQLNQSLADQMAQANRAAASAGRSGNDPILRARLGAEAMRQQAQLAANQSSAAVDFARQSGLDQVSLRGQEVNALQGLAQQAFAGQQMMFDMGQSLQNTDLNLANYEMGRGGGLKGAITGAIQGAGAGLQMATGFSNMSNAAKLTDAGINTMKAQQDYFNAGAKAMPQMAKAMMTTPSFNQIPMGNYDYPIGPAPAPSFPSVGASSLTMLTPSGVLNKTVPSTPANSPTISPANDFFSFLLNTFSTGQKRPGEF